MQVDDTLRSTDPATPLERRLGDRLSALWRVPVSIDNLVRLSGGASRETLAVDARAAGTVHHLILRCDHRTTHSADLSVEAAAMTAAAKAGVPVPAVRDAGDARSCLGSSYLLMDRIEGETIPRRLLRNAEFRTVRSRLAAEFGALLARIHTASLPSESVFEDVDDPLDSMVAAYCRSEPPSPALQIGLRWLRENRPDPGPRVLVHGDFRLGNLLIDRTGVRAVLDWELVHLGDPLEDLGWLCAKVWRFGSRHPAGGMGTREDLLDAYAAIAGWRPSAEQLRWWELHATVRWGLMCRFQAHRHLSGAQPSLELAAIGRRSCEQEHDVLLALGCASPEEIPDPLAESARGTAKDGPHARPTVDELVGVVGQHLADEVVRADDASARYKARLAVNVLSIVQRQLTLGHAQHGRHRTRLAGLGCADDAALSEAIKAGALDHRWPDVIKAVRESVRDQLLVANPRHLSVPY